VSARREPPVLADLRWLTGSTFRICLKHRVTGLAAEIAFFALLSLPPLLLGLAGTLGYFADVIGPDTVEHFRRSVIDLAQTVLSDQTVADTIIPTLNDVLTRGRFDIISVGFLLALWSGSRALNVTIDTIAIMYGLGGHRGIIATRALSFSLYVVGLMVGVVLLPLVLGGPRLFALAVPGALSWVASFYWPIVTIGSVASLTTLFWIALPVPNSWWRGMPGAVLGLSGAFLGSYVVRVIINWSVGGTSIYGPLAAPIIMLIWLYYVAIVMLIGAAFNAATDKRWPHRADDVTLDGVATAETAAVVKTPPPPRPPDPAADLLADAPAAPRRAVQQSSGRLAGR
jgi:membrane protein